jgi:hypothetical protein
MLSRSSLLSIFAAILYLGSIQSHASSYQLLLESDVDGDAGNEIFLASFDSFQSLLDGTVAGSSFSQLNVNPNFSAGGLAFDGSSYQLLLESDADGDAGNEIFLASFDSFQSLLDGTVASSSFSQLNINPNFSAGGLAFDGSYYQLLLEADADSDAGNEIFLAGFDGLQDLLDGTIADSSFSQLNINSNFSAGGLVAYAPGDPTEVPEPASWGVLMFGLGALMLRRRRPR